MNALVAPDHVCKRTKDAFGDRFQSRDRFVEDIQAHVTKYVREWEATGRKRPNWGPIASTLEKESNEREANRHIQELRRLLLNCPKVPAGRETWRRMLLNALRPAAACGCGAGHADVDILFTESAMEATQRFIREARQFEPRISEEDLFQALRNLWVIHSIQLILDRPLGLSPSLFAYSMLYPWTDNYLDDSSVPRPAKASFGVWLARVLQGQSSLSTSTRAEQVRRLVGLIEADYPRREYPGVYLSLQAIHRAQTESVRQQGQGEFSVGSELERITITKGGTSVLTDAYLVRGHLTLEQADFMFGYGVLLQLMDDIQDLPDDLARGHNTIATEHAAVGSLDAMVSRLWCFAVKRLGGEPGSDAISPEPVNRLILGNCKRILFHTIALKPEFCSKRFVAMLEGYSPFSFDFLRARAKSLVGEWERVVSSLMRTHHVSSFFELMD